MLAQLGAKLAAVCPVGGKRLKLKRVGIGVAAAGALVLAGCKTTSPLVLGHDPSDPGARVARVGYRSTVAPYTSLRPVTPSSWRERNDRVAPAPKSDAGGLR